MTIQTISTGLRGRWWWSRLRRPSLTLGLLFGLAVYALLALVTDMGGRARFICAWDAGASLTLVALFFGLRRSPASAIKLIAARQDAGKWAVLVLSLLAAIASLVVIAAESPLVKSASGVEQAARFVLMLYTIVLSWLFIQTIFALHYAHDYYLDVDQSSATPATTTARLIFPGHRAPTYGDFLYFSFTIGMTFQVSDVQIADADMRRLALVHGAVAFFYATGILALTINLIAGLI